MHTKGVGFWVGAGIPKGKRSKTFVECGCCGAYHRSDFAGDCREDSERYHEIPDGAVLVGDDWGCDVETRESESVQSQDLALAQHRKEHADKRA